MSDFAFTAVSDLAAMIHAKALSPTELVEHFLDRIDKHNPDINAVVSLDADRSRAEAATATGNIARGITVGPLTGIPVVVKDLENARGFPTSRGTKAFCLGPDAVADSIHVARLRRAGAIVIGKTNAPPMGAAIHTDNDAFGTTRNPWNPMASAGGSSGGSAAAVAAGLAPLATAGDGGGSTRIPAALCGIVGLKPTRGRIPAASPAWTHHSCPTPMGRSVRDTALHLDIVAGYHPADTFSVPDPGYSYRGALDRPSPRLRVGVNRTFGVANPHPDILHAVERATQSLRSLGHQVMDDNTALPGAETFPASLQLRQQILAYIRFTAVRDEFDSRPEDFEPWFAAILDSGRATTLDDLARYWEYRSRLDVWAADLFEPYDLLLTPTTPTTAWPAEGPDMSAALRDRTIPITYTSVFNDTGNPAISIPMGLSADGLPCAVQLIAPHHRDDLLLQVGAALEREAGQLRPPL